MTPAETLRAAAKLMRERAAGANARGADRSKNLGDS